LDRRHITPLAFFTLCLVAALPASAQQPPPPPAEGEGETEAMTRFKRGLELYAEQDFAGALIELRRVYELQPTYRILFNIGQVCYQLADYACALRSFEQYLRDGAGKIATERKVQVEHDIAKLTLRVGRVEIVTNVPGVDISIDDVYIGKTPLPNAVPVSSGRRRVSATKEGRAPITRIVEVAGTDSMRVELELVDTTTKVRYAESPPSKWTGLSWAGVGIAGALAITGGVTGVLALDASKDLKEERFAGPEPSAEVRSKQKDVRTLALVSDVFLGASIVTLGATLVLTFTRESPKARASGPKVDLAFSGKSVLLKGRF
jgi:hypothetical protein